MSNLLKETGFFLARHNKTLNDVEMFCGDDFQISREDFIKLADKEYDDGFGGQMVAKDLKLVGTDWWIERKEYDGAEGWSFKTIPNRDKPLKSVQTLMVRYGTEDLSWSTLAELNREDDEYD